MNLYGIVTAIQAYYRVFQETARQTGRTREMLDDLSNGDCVIVPSANHINYIQSMARKKGLNIRVEVVSPSMLDISNLRAIKGQVVFDHAFVEQYFDNELLSSEYRLKELSEHLNRNN
ncbi:hypothetical protein VPHD273_0082 [Vibrio phage D273]|nr:hypothetical protein PODOV087v1_p0078 [Vibrio phage 431E45.1]QZI91633.1 hypothetical protein PODOV086v1_p0049 [Vibrio phage 431E46.1]QZI91666.1 hypothetical protein PODOV088v1_p0005 [Vibrio phage 431E48.2]